MKTTMIARCVFAGAAIFAAAGLIGCGAEGQGAVGEGVGETSQALSTCTTAGTATTFASAEERELTEGCTIADLQSPNNPTFVYAGGKTAAGAISDKIYTSTTGVASGYTLQTAVLSVARFDVKAFKLDANTCAFVAGMEGATTASKKVDLVTVTNGVASVNTLTDLAVARHLPQVSTCGGKLMVVGGLDASDQGLRSIEVNKVGGWNSNNTALPVGVGRGAIAKSSGFDRYALAGGRNASSAPIATVYGLDGTGSCDPNSGFAVSDITNLSTGNAAVLNQNADGNVGWFVATTSTNGNTNNVDEFIFAAGRASTAPTGLNVKADHIKVDWTTKANSSRPSQDTITGTFRPSFIDAGSNHVYLLAGSNAQGTTSLTLAQEYSGSWQTTCSVSVGHFSAPAGLLSSVAYLPGGRILGTGVTTKVDSAQ